LDLIQVRSTMMVGLENDQKKKIRRTFDRTISVLVSQYIV